MTKQMKNFLLEEDGAVTVDFVILTAALVILAIIVGNAVSRGAVDLANRQGQSLADRPVGTAGY